MKITLPNRPWTLGLLVLFVVVITLVTGRSLHGPLLEGGEYSFAFLVLLYANLFLVLILGFLVIRNLSRLWMDRKRKLAGAMLRTRMVLMFALLSLLPTLIISILSLELLNRGVDSWFSDRISLALEQSLEVARSYYQENQRSIRHDAEDLVRNRTITAALTLQGGEAATAALEVERSARMLDEITILRQDGTRLASAGDLPQDALPDFSALEAGGSRAMMVTNDTGNRVRAYIRLGEGDLILTTGRWIDRQVLTRMESMENAFKNYHQLRTSHGLLKNSHTITLVLITQLLLLAAVWSGFRIADTITLPVGELVMATRKVASGDLSATMKVRGDDELATLMAAFNAMTQRLAENRQELEATNALLEERQRFLAAIVNNISSGVIAVDGQGLITLINRAAGELLGLDPQQGHGQACRDLLPPEMIDLLQNLRRLAASQRVLEVDPLNGVPLSAQIPHQGPDRQRTLLARIGLLGASPSENTGFIATFDDLTEVVMAQRAHAWSDVARRIAHEIKNPLTPIQLWAQRLRRKYLDNAKEPLPEREVLDQGTTAIISQVEALRLLVNEFSNFARLPRPDRQKGDLHQALKECLTLHDTELKAVSSAAEFDSHVPPFPFDASQIKQVVTNLLSNALAAMKEKEEQALQSETPFKPQLVLSTHLSTNGQWVSVQIMDNGPGIPAADRVRVFEPYFTTKKKGTGLGLAIAKKIIEDHGGVLRMRESSWGGVNAEFQLPIKGPANSGDTTADETVPPL
ncbi:MAG: HAMP domain-containing protein [Magnetococcales bacterium]|nr:HAMP domain-containing protein [Magnetococcales bacterium]